MIKNISIKNFRSISSESFDVGGLTTFVGKNDAGKSNILRAINLFFNDETDYGSDFDFEKDFNRNAKVGKNKARQIEIELKIELPESFRRKGRSRFVIWRKVWRESGLHYPLMKQRYSDGVDFSSYSKIPTFLDRLAFYYIPAIKDRHFFSDLQGKMYDILADAAESKLRASAKGFEGDIKKQISELIDLVTLQFGDKNDIRLPENLRMVFEVLEFNANGMPLSRRGDGIKIRHIPMILKFIGEKRNALLTGGAIKYTNIWGFEEPENNLELSAAFDMASTFEEVACSGCQVLITTHSPAFYEIGKEAEDLGVGGAVVHGVKKVGDETVVYGKLDEKIHDEMGVMPLIAPFIKKEKEKWEKVVEEKHLVIKELKKEAGGSVPTIFVEGKTDELVLKKVLKVFYEDLHDVIKVNSGGNGGYGSSNAVVSRLIAWQLIQQAERNSVKAAGLLDDDKSGSDSEQSFIEMLNILYKSKRQIGKAFRLKRNKRIGILLKGGFHIPVEMEAFYPDEIWEMAKSEGWLEEASIGDRLSNGLLSCALQNGESIEDIVNEKDRLRVLFDWTDKGKLKAAEAIIEMDEQRAREVLADFHEAVKPAISHVVG